MSIENNAQQEVIDSKNFPKLWEATIESKLFINENPELWELTDRFKNSSDEFVVKFWNIFEKTTIYNQWIVDRKNIFS